MDRIRELAELSIGRACGFALIAVVTVVIGLSAHMPSALAAGGELALIGALTLLFLSWRAEFRPYKRTEVWLMLDKAERPPVAVAQQLVGTAMREAYLYFARLAAWLAAGQLASAVLLGVVHELRG